MSPSQGVTVYLAPGEGKGQWQPVRHDPSGRRSAAVRCPSCGALIDLDAHSISIEGDVQPAVRCDCGFHERVILRGWDPRETGL